MYDGLTMTDDEFRRNEFFGCYLPELQAETQLLIATDRFGATI